MNESKNSRTKSSLTKKILWEPLDDIQKLKAKDLKEILKSNSKSTDGIRADLVSKVYALLM